MLPSTFILDNFGNSATRSIAFSFFSLRYMSIGPALAAVLQISWVSNSCRRHCRHKSGRFISMEEHKFSSRQLGDYSGYNRYDTACGLILANTEETRCQFYLVK